MPASTKPTMVSRSWTSWTTRGWTGLLAEREDPVVERGKCTKGTGASDPREIRRWLTRGDPAAGMGTAGTRREELICQRA